MSVTKADALQTRLITEWLQSDAREAIRILTTELDKLREENEKLRDENAMISEVNAEQARRLGLYQQDARQRMARE